MPNATIAFDRDIVVVQHVPSVPLHIVEHDGQRSRTIRPRGPHRHIVVTEMK